MREFKLAQCGRECAGLTECHDYADVPECFSKISTNQLNSYWNLNAENPATAGFSLEILVN